MDNEYKDSIIDSSKPNAGRVYDYLLGGSFNFKIDRQAGEQIKKVIPYAPKMSQLVRWFLGKGTTKALELGFNKFIDFASGLPTINHIHSNVPPETRVIYSDIDPITVQHGKKIIGDNPNVKYMVCDICTPEILLKSEEVNELIGNNHKVAIGFNGICYFLSDDQIHNSMNIIYNWVEKGSILFFVDMDYDAKNIKKDVQTLIDAYERMNQPFFFRSKEKMAELVKPWSILDPGFLNLEEWHKMPSKYSKEAVELFGSGIGFYGGFLIK